MMSNIRLTRKIHTNCCHFAKPYQSQENLPPNVIDLFFCEIIEKAIHGHYILKRQRKSMISK